MALAIHYPRQAVKKFLENRFPDTDWSIVIDQMLLKSEEEILNSNPNMSDEQLAQSLSFAEMFISPTAMIVYSVLGNMIFGTILSLLIAIFVKREDNSLA